MWIKLDSAVANVPANKNISSVGIPYSYMYELWVKKYCNIFWCDCPDTVMSSIICHFYHYSNMPLETWSTNIEHTLRYAQSMAHQELHRNLTYQLLQIQNVGRKAIKNVVNRF